MVEVGPMEIRTFELELLLVPAGVEDGKDGKKAAAPVVLAEEGEGGWMMME
jgi:hypothetical protein